MAMFFMATSRYIIRIENFLQNEMHAVDTSVKEKNKRKRPKDGMKFDYFMWWFKSIFIFTPYS